MITRIIGLLAAGLLLSAHAIAGDFEALLRSVEQCDADPGLCQSKAEQAIQRLDAATEAFEESRTSAAAAAGRQPGTIRLGDSQHYVRSQWGAPRAINRTTSSLGHHEWWWFETDAVHFANGRVDSIHTGR